MTELLTTLRNLDPVKVRVIDGDDVRVIEVPKRRRRWQHVIATIGALPWERAELLSKDGSTLGYVINGDAPAAEDLEDISAPADGASLDAIAQGERIAALALRTGERMLAAKDAELSTLIRAQSEVVRELVAGMRSLSSVWEANARARAEVASLETQAQLGNGDAPGQLAQLVEAAPMLLQMLPMLRSMFTPPPAASPGVAK